MTRGNSPIWADAWVAEQADVRRILRLKRMRPRLTTLAMVLLACGACTQAATIDDRRLLDYASRSYDKRGMENTTVRLGAHLGTPVIAEFPCSDMCPDYTVRIVHYALAEGQSCSEVGGVEKSILVPMGIGQIERTYCFPAILVENWSRYKM